MWTVVQKNKADLDAKLGVTRSASNSVDNSICKASTSILRLGHAQQNKWAPLKVCEWRLALRERRPPRELFRDHVHEALEKEQHALVDSRARLVELANEGKAILEDCEANKARLTRNVRCMVCLGHTKLPALVPDNNELPPCPSSPSDLPPEGGASPLEGEDNAPAKSKPVVPSDPEGLLKRAPQLQDIVERFEKKCDNSIAKHKDRCARANEEVIQCFQEAMG